MSTDTSVRGSAPELRLNGDPVIFDARRVGHFGTNLTTGRIVFVSFNTKLRIKNSYSITADLLEQLDDDVTTFFVMDNETKRVYRFHRSDYFDAPLVHFNGQSQFCPDADDHRGVWEYEEAFE